MNRLPPPENGNRFVGWVRRLVRHWLLNRDEKRASRGCLTCQHWQRRDDERDRLHLTFNVGICTRCNLASKSYDWCPNHKPNSPVHPPQVGCDESSDHDSHDEQTYDERP